MIFLELSDYSLKSDSLGSGINPCFFSARKGEIWRVESNNVNDLHLLLSGIATLSYPVQGTYIFDGARLNFSDYRHLLGIKKRIGYIASDATLISNRTIRENIIINRTYFENDLSLELKENERDICDSFGINDVLDVRPVALKPPDFRKAILIRELIKKPDVIIIEYPVEFAGHDIMGVLISHLIDAISSGAVLIYSSYNKEFVNEFTHNTLSINNGWITKTYPSET